MSDEVRERVIVGLCEEKSDKLKARVRELSRSHAFNEDRSIINFYYLEIIAVVNSNQLRYALQNVVSIEETNHIFNFAPLSLKIVKHSQGLLFYCPNIMNESPLVPYPSQSLSIFPDLRLHLYLYWIAAEALAP